MGNKETPIQAEIYAAIRKDDSITIVRHNVYKPGYQRRVNVPKTEIGVADFILCIGGRYVEMEVKAPGGDMSPEQVERALKINGMGGIYVVARSSQDALMLVDWIKKGAKNAV